MSAEKATSRPYACGERVGFELVGRGERTSALGLRSFGQLIPDEPLARMVEEPPERQTEDQTAEWYARYYARAGADRNELRSNPGVLFQIVASERSLIRALYRVPELLSEFDVLDVGCGAAGTWYQLFRLGVKPRKTVGIDLQWGRLVSARDFYPRCGVIHCDGTSMPFANASFHLVYESTLFATLPDDGVRARIAAEMLRVCKPNGYLLLVDWRTPKFWDRSYKALTRAEVRKLFGVGKSTRILGVSKGALVPPLGRLLSAHAAWLYFGIAAICPSLIGQIVYLLRRGQDSADTSAIR